MKRTHFGLLILSAMVFSLFGTVLQPLGAPEQPASSAAGPVISSTRNAAPGVVPRCEVPKITAPKPTPIPGQAELDPSTGLHYTGPSHVVTVDLESYRLEVSGKVDHPLTLPFDELRCLPKTEVKTIIACKGNFDDTAVWAGASLKYLLELAGIQEEAKDIRLIGADGYEASVARDDAMSGRAFLAYEWAKQPVPVIHGFPVRAAFPGLAGSNWVKWLVKIEVY